MRLFLSITVIFLISISSSYASKSKDLRKIDKMYDDGLLTRSECVKAKKKFWVVIHLQNAKKL